VAGGESDQHVLRIWRGVTSTDRADDYEDYLNRTGLVGYTETPGNMCAYFSRRDIDNGVEFCLVTVWESLEAIKGFAGPNPEIAVYYPEDDEFLVEREPKVSHYQVFTMRRAP
jgi:hypothetical protein